MHSYTPNYLALQTVLLKRCAYQGDFTIERERERVCFIVRSFYVFLYVLLAALLVYEHLSACVLAEEALERWILAALSLSVVTKTLERHSERMCRELGIW